MKENVLILLFFSFCFQFSYSQNPGEWVWIHGSNTTGSPGNYGTQGVPNAINEPPAIYEPCSWTDLNGNFWFYGGDNGSSFFADLWKYDPTTNQWTWMKGPGTNAYLGYYGIQGVPSPTNNPPNRCGGATTWVDNQGYLWMFGGYSSNGTYSDLWKYNVATNQWTWMMGPNTPGKLGTYGIQGIAAPSNNPGCRWETSTGWTDNSGDLWFYGGAGGFNAFNDLWRFNIATNMWTWMKGSSTLGKAPVYGTIGVEDSLNDPGGRGVYSHWKDNSGNLWLFGGYPFYPNNLNDLWRYKLSTNNWTWIGGNNTMNATGSYGPKCSASSSNIPGARMESRTVWTDDNGNFLMFGGGSGASFANTFNDLWLYSVASNLWSWIGGSNVANPSGSWGTIGVSSPTNRPNGRGGCVGWSDHSCHLYIFGGYSNSFSGGPYNDLWKYTLDPSCGTCTQLLPNPNFTCSDSIFCDEGGKCINFFDHSANNPTSWKWLFPVAVPDSSNQQNPTNICYNAPGTYSVTLIVTNSAGKDTLTISPMITFGQIPPAPILSLSHDTVFCSPATHYQWYYNGNIIPDATDSFYVAINDGSYNVYITDSLGCGRLGNGVLFLGVNEFGENAGFWVYPNPAKDNLIIKQFDNLIIHYQIEIYNVLGEKVLSLQQEIINKKQETVIDVSALSKGVYVVQVAAREKVYRNKFIKE